MDRQNKPSGDPPDGTETTIRGNENGLFAAWLSAVPVGGSPTGAGESPAPPIFKTRSNFPLVSPRVAAKFSLANRLERVDSIVHC